MNKKSNFFCISPPKKNYISVKSAKKKTPPKRVVLICAYYIYHGYNATSLTQDDLELLKDCIKAQSKDKQRYLRYVANSPLNRRTATGAFNELQRRKGAKFIDGRNVQRDCIRYIRAGLKTGRHSELLISLVNTFTKY